LWLDPEFQDRDKLVAMLQPFPADEMKVRPVNTYVSNARNEGPDCIEPAGDE
jgi:putative SOS response-associated peptidase YedK